MALTTVPVELANLDGAVTVNESSADVDFRIESNGNANMLFVNGGNDQVGIGADPSALFHVTHGGGGFDEVARLTAVANSAGDGAFLGFHGNSTSKFYGFIGGYDIDTNKGGVKIGVGNGETSIADSMTALTIDNVGKVGIGTATPGSYNANADDLVIFDDNVHAGMTIAGGTNDYGNIYFAQGTSGSDAYRGYIQYGHSATTDAAYRDVMLFGTATLERMRIRSDGNVGIGAVGMPSYSGYTQLSVGAMGHILAHTASTTNGALFLSQNAHFDADGSWETMETDEATLYYQNAGMHIWQRAASTSAGTDITWLDSMRLTANGTFLHLKSTDDVDTIGNIFGTGGQVYSSTTSSNNTYHYRDTTNTRYNFYVGGNGQVNARISSIALISDGRLKENVRDYTVGLNDILKLKPRVFDWIPTEGEKNQVGFIAQEFEEVFPDWVGSWLHDELEDAKSVSASEIIYPMVNAIKELSTEIESLKAEIKVLKEA